MLISSLSARWPRRGPRTRCCPRKAPPIPRAWRVVACGSWTRWTGHGSIRKGDRVAGAVALPGLGLVLSSHATDALCAPAARLRMLVSRTRPGADSVAVAERIGADLVAMGSAGAKAMAVVRGEAEIYLHSGGQYEWDSCAPVAVARAHGLHVSRADGSALIYNRENPWMPDLLICRPEWAEAVLRETCQTPVA